MSNDEIAQRWASPKGLGSFAPPSALLVAYRPTGLLAPHALNLDKIPQANVKVFAGHYTSTVYARPEVSLNFKTDKAGTIYASSYCNIHGLWQGYKELKVV